MDYIPYGEEWIKEMNKLPKDAILRMFSKMGIEKNQEYQQLKNSKTGDRDCEELKKDLQAHSEALLGCSKEINSLKQGLKEIMIIADDTTLHKGLIKIWNIAKQLLK